MVRLPKHTTCDDQRQTHQYGDRSATPVSFAPTRTLYVDLGAGVSRHCLHDDTLRTGHLSLEWTLQHDAEAFSLVSQRCFRFIQAEDGTGHAQHCPYLTKWQGRFQDGAGKWHAIEACDGYQADLTSVQLGPLTAGQYGPTMQLRELGLGEPGVDCV